MIALKIEIWSAENRSIAAEFEVKKTITIGREAEVTLLDQSVSRRHAKLAIDEKGVLTITDLDSTNGVIVNGRKVLHAQIGVDSHIVIGNHRLVVKAENLVKHDWPGKWQCMTVAAKTRFQDYY